ncbi:MAG: hypothetical protein IJC88_01125 [Oscillospiraceae bacterium]|nr:hypothetical protein [Oscillospiraceae bacterium]
MQLALCNLPCSTTASGTRLAPTSLKTILNRFFNARCPLRVQISPHSHTKKNKPAQKCELILSGGEGEILPVCGARNFATAHTCKISTAAQPCALLASATGGSRARFPLAGARHGSSNPNPKQKEKTGKSLSFLFGGEGEI